MLKVKAKLTYSGGFMEGLTYCPYPKTDRSCARPK